MPRNNNRRNNARTNESGEYKGHSSFTLSGFGRLARQPKVFFNAKDESYTLRAAVIGMDGQSADVAMYCGTFKRAKFLGELPAGTSVGFTGHLDTYTKRDKDGKFLSKELRVQINHLDPMDSTEIVEQRWAQRIAKGDKRLKVIEGVGTADGTAAPVAGVAGFTAEQMAGLGNLLAAFAANGGAIPTAAPAAAPAAAPVAAAPAAAPAAEVTTLASAIADEGEAFDVEEEEAVEG